MYLRENEAHILMGIFLSNFVYLNGYWQNELYFANIRELLLENYRY